MEFEDIFNMDWVSNEDASPPTDYALVEPLAVEEKEPMPTLDQIKQLIEIAKQQIALKDQEMQTAAPSVIFAPPAAEESMEEDKSSVKEEGTEESVTTLEAYAAADGIDLKKLSSKERRQLRNKLSARNFRVRRKEYITSLEEQVAEQKKTTEKLREKLNIVEDENKTLKKEMDLLKRQNQQLQSSTRLLPKTNINKDISPLDSCRQQDHPYHTSILVSSAVMPSWDLNLILQERENPMLKQMAGYFLLCMMQMYQNRPKKSLEDLYDILIQDSLINNSTIDPSFRWSDSSFVN